MVKFPEAEVRKFRNIFVCRRCKTKIRSSSMRIKSGKVKCRKCNTHSFRAVRKK